jgi:hypothetical protein
MTGVRVVTSFEMMSPQVQCLAPPGRARTRLGTSRAALPVREYNT